MNGRNTNLRMLSFVAIWILAVAAAPMTTLGQDEDIQTGPTESIFVPAPREIARPFAHARRAVQEQRYQDAVELLGDLLTSQTYEDFLIPSAEFPHMAVSLHREAQKLLGRIDKRYRSDYELKYSVEARQMLEEAISNTDYVAMAKVFRHYFFTPAGFNAAMLLGHHYLELGQPVSAAAYFSAVVNHPDARASHDPAASILLATCCLMGNQTERAETTLIDFRQRWARDTVPFMGGEVELFDDDGQALAWLVKLIGESSLSRLEQVDQWLLFRGNPQRNAQSGTGFPLSFARWQVPTINDPQQETIAQFVFEERLANDQPLIPSVQPLAVGNTIILRSLDRMVGVDFRTGKRVWEYPAWQEDAVLDTLQQVQQLGRERIDSSHIEQRLWNDHLYGQSCSNGELIFVIDHPGFATNQSDNRAILRQGVLMDDPLGGRATNELKAIELTREGAFRWEVGGPTGGVEPKLKGCFFLGPPLPMNGKLYALCEISSELRLVVLDDATGELLWSQQLAAIDLVQPGERDPNRRLAGASPSFSDGILICPTTASALVAIELATRSLLWGVQYPSIYNTRRDTKKINQLQLSNMQPMGMAPFADASVTIADGHVIVMPAESNQIFCFDLLDGSSKWEIEWLTMGVDRRDGLYIACVYGDTIVLIGDRAVRGLSLRDGSPMWQMVYGGLGRPTGRGFLTGTHYFLPMSTAAIAKIDVSTGSVVDSIKTDRILGNLICFGTDVVSHGFDCLTTYRQAAPTRDRVRIATETNQWTPELRRLSAQLLMQDGKLMQAAETADGVYRETGDPKSARLLFGLILDLMKQDFAAAAPFVNRYEREMTQVGGGEFITEKIDGLIRTNDAAGAVRTLVDMASNIDDWIHSRDAVGDFKHLDDGQLKVKVNYWIRSRLDEAAASDDGGEFVFRGIDEQLNAASPRVLSRVSEWIGFRNLPAQKRLELARDLVDRRRYLQAERLLTRLIDDPDVSIAGPATAAMAVMLTEAGWPDSAIQLREDLQDQFADQVVYQNLSGRELASQLFPDPTPARDWKDWPPGELVGVSSRQRNTQMYATRGIEFPKLQSISGICPDSIQVEVSTQNYLATIRDANGYEIGNVSFIPADHQRIYVTSSIMFGEFSLIGHLLVLNSGTELIGIDLFKLRRGENALAWQKTFNPKRSDESSSRQVFGRVKTQSVNKWGESRIYVVDNYQNQISGFTTNLTDRVYYRVHDSAYCIDAFDGSLVWQREQLEPSTTLTAWDESIYLLRRENPDEIIRLDEHTGRMQGTIEIPVKDPRQLWHKSGNRLLLTGNEKSSLVLEMYDLREQRIVWRESFPGSSVGTVVDNQTMAVYQRNGRLRYFDLRSGQTTIELEMESRQRVQNLQVLRLSEHDVIVMNSHQYRTQVNLTNYQYYVQGVNRLDNLIEGHLICLDRNRGELLWPSPVYVENFCLPAGHPRGLPLLVLNRMINHTIDRRGVRFNEFYTIDLRSGRLANVVITDTRNGYSTYVRHDPQTAVTEIVTGDELIQLRFRAADLPPTAPASLSNESTLDNTQQHLQAKIDAKKSPLQQALERLKNHNGNPEVPGLKPKTP